MNPTLAAIASWISSCRPDDCHCAEALVPLLNGSAFLRHAIVSKDTDINGHLFIEFQPVEPGGSQTVTRRMKLIHAAIVAALECVGAEIYYGSNRDKGRNRYKLWLRFGPICTTLARILFNTPDSGRLCERPGHYPTIAPSSFYYKPSAGRADVVHEAARRAPYAPSSVSVIREMFEQADRWHGNELEHVRQRPCRSDGAA